MRAKAAIAAAAIALLVLAAASPASAGVRTYKLRFGPIALDGYQVKQNSNPVRNPRVNGYITRMRAHVVDRQGRDIPVQRVMLHHVLFTNRGVRNGDRHDGACPGPTWLKARARMTGRPWPRWAWTPRNSAATLLAA